MTPIQIFMQLTWTAVVVFAAVLVLALIGLGTVIRLSLKRLRRR